MRQTNYKVDKIKVFIQGCYPTKSQLVEHIVVDINNRVSREFYQKYKRLYRGYYNTNIQQMRRAGNIAIDLDGRYYVTPQGLVNEKSLYIKPDKVIIRDLKSLVNRKGEMIREERYENRKLRKEVSELKERISNIHYLSQ